ncbi:MAG: hypothetical protein HYZ54_03535 [Ignavibacteriae bacterium]|nr:hypothetical protein [Ignavibacteriota bacterium]
MNHFSPFRLFTGIALTIILLSGLSHNSVYANIPSKPEKMNEMFAPDGSGAKFTLIKPGSDDFSSFKIPENSFLRHHLHVEFSDIDMIFSIIQTSATKSIIIGKNDDNFIFAEMDIEAQTFTVKSKFLYGGHDRVDLILLKGEKLYIYTSFTDRLGRKPTLIQREFDAKTFTYSKSRMLMSAGLEDGKDLPKILGDNSSKLIMPPSEAFVGKNIDIIGNRVSVRPSEDSSKVIVSCNLTDDDKGEHLIICEHVLQTDVVNLYSFPASPKIQTDMPEVTSTGSTIVIQKVITNKDKEYLSNRTYFINERKIDSIDYTLTPLFKGVKDPDEITCSIDNTSIINKSGIYSIFFNIRREQRKTIGLAKVDIDPKQKKILSQNFLKFDEDFRKKHKIEDDLFGFITDATVYTPNGDLMLCIEGARSLATSSGIRVGTTYNEYHLFCYSSDMNCKWAYSNQERSVHTQNQNYLNGFSCTDYSNNHISITTVEDEKEKGLWIHQLDPATGKIVKSEMPIDFSGTIAFPTNCLRNFSGKYYIIQPIDSPTELQIFAKK